MAAHILHFTITGSTFSDIENEAARRVAAYTGWGIRKSKTWIDEHAEIDAHPTAQLLDGTTVSYTADVKVTV